MTKDEALKWALEALENSRIFVTSREKIKHPEGTDWYDERISAIKEALAQPEQDNTYIYASSLATAIWQKHYMKESPKFAPLDTTEGVLTQIDNMTCGLVREKPAQPEQEPVAWQVMVENEAITEFSIKDMAHDWCAHQKLSGSSYTYWIRPLYTTPPQGIYYTPPQRTWVDLTDDEMLMIYGQNHEGKKYNLGRMVQQALKEKNS